MPLDDVGPVSNLETRGCRKVDEISRNVSVRIALQSGEKDNKGGDHFYGLWKGGVRVRRVGVPVEESN